MRLQLKQVSGRPVPGADIPQPVQAVRRIRNILDKQRRQFVQVQQLTLFRCIFGMLAGQRVKSLEELATLRSPQFQGTRQHASYMRRRMAALARLQMIDIRPREARCLCKLPLGHTTLAAIFS